MLIHTSRIYSVVYPGGNDIGLPFGLNNCGLMVGRRVVRTVGIRLVHHIEDKQKKAGQKNTYTLLVIRSLAGIIHTYINIMMILGAQLAGALFPW